MVDLVWRVGWASSPLTFPPREYCSWDHRFDDPEHRYRTLYAANEPITCFRERLGDLRPNTKALADFENFSDGPTHFIAGEVRWKLREEHVLVSAKISISRGEIIDIEDVTILQHLAQLHAASLHKAGIDHLNIGELRSAPRQITQAISRSLYDKGAAGILFRSKYDNQLCIALFEDRAFLTLAGDPEPLTKPLSTLLQVCSQYNLILREAPNQ